MWWRGGGVGVAAYYGYLEDGVSWHSTARAACDPFGSDVYPRLKKWCDDYFFLPHRHEPRGIGGLFYDDLNEWGFEQTFAFMRSVGYAHVWGGKGHEVDTGQLLASTETPRSVGE